MRACEFDTVIDCYRHCKQYLQEPIPSRYEAALMRDLKRDILKLMDAELVREVLFDVGEEQQQRLAGDDSADSAKQEISDHEREMSKAADLLQVLFSEGLDALIQCPEAKHLIFGVDEYAAAEPAEQMPPGETTNVTSNVSVEPLDVLTLPQNPEFFCNEAAVAQPDVPGNPEQNLIPYVPTMTSPAETASTFSPGEQYPVQPQFQGLPQPMMAVEQYPVQPQFQGLPQVPPMMSVEQYPVQAQFQEMSQPMMAVEQYPAQPQFQELPQVPPMMPVEQYPTQPQFQELPQVPPMMSVEQYPVQAQFQEMPQPMMPVEQYPAQPQFQELPQVPPMMPVEQYPAQAQFQELPQVPPMMPVEQYPAQPQFQGLPQPMMAVEQYPVQAQFQGLPQPMMPVEQYPAQPQFQELPQVPPMMSVEQYPVQAQFQEMPQPMMPVEQYPAQPQFQELPQVPPMMAVEQYPAQPQFQELPAMTPVYFDPVPMVQFAPEYPQYVLQPVPFTVADPNVGFYQPDANVPITTYPCPQPTAIFI
ncbi:protein PELPK1-like [Anopheles stephensi]|uniref:protein PELPK1-like n=1 Tax=Anopheles stephensi TaxID=30069 RepID=UPI001658A02F|nr:protein PELPK1-like [Anopheles stephensi]